MSDNSNWQKKPGSIVRTLESIGSQIRRGRPFGGSCHLSSLRVSAAKEQGWDRDQGLLVAHHHLKSISCHTLYKKQFVRITRMYPGFCIFGQECILQREPATSRLPSTTITSTTKYYLLKPTKLVSALTRLLSDRPWCHASLERF